MADERVLPRTATLGEIGAKKARVPCKGRASHYEGRDFANYWKKPYMSAAPESGQASKKPLAPGLVGFAILLFFPLGFYLLWNHPTLGKNLKWWGAGIVWAVVYVVANLNRSETTIAHSITASDSAPGIASPPQDGQPIKRSFWGPKELAYGKRIDLCDNPDKYKDMEMRMEVKYVGGGLRTNGKLISMPCMVFYGDGSFNMQFEIPGDVSQVRIEPGQYLMVTFIFSGSVDSPSRVLAISRQ